MTRNNITIRESLNFIKKFKIYEEKHSRMSLYDIAKKWAEFEHETSVKPALVLEYVEYLANNIIGVRSHKYEEFLTELEENSYREEYGYYLELKEIRKQLVNLVETKKWAGSKKIQIFDEQFDALLTLLDISPPVMIFERPIEPGVIPNQSKDSDTERNIHKKIASENHTHAAINGIQSDYFKGLVQVIDTAIKQFPEWKNNQNKSKIYVTGPSFMKWLKSFKLPNGKNIVEREAELIKKVMKDIYPNDLGENK